MKTMKLLPQKSNIHFACMAKSFHQIVAVSHDLSGKYCIE